MAYTEIVDMGLETYAIRRTEKFMWFIDQIDYLDMNSSSPVWRKRSDGSFERCLTRSLEVAQRRDALYGCGLGEPVINGMLSIQELNEISKIALTNEGVKDLLLQAKEFAILAKKNGS